MFIGHFGAGLAAKKLDRKISLGTLFLASQFIDLLWPFFLLIGLEKVKIDPGNTAFTPLDFISYPYSHSFIGVLIWALLFGTVYFLFKRNMKGAAILAALVMSHWVLDLITHRPDLPLFPWMDIKAGFGLWNSVIATLIIEGTIFGTGAFIYLRSTKAENRKGKNGLWGLLIFLVIVYCMNVFGSPPPSEEAISYTGFSQWVIIIWGYWIDRNRKAAEKSLLAKRA